MRSHQENLKVLANIKNYCYFLKEHEAWEAVVNFGDVASCGKLLFIDIYKGSACLD